MLNTLREHKLHRLKLRCMKSLLQRMSFVLTSMITTSAILSFLVVSASYAQTTETFTTSGNWTVPCGVTSVTVSVYGAGGGGGGSNTGGQAGGGGGAGGFASSTFVVVPGAIIPYTVGAGGIAGSTGGGNGGNGGSTSWNGGAVVGTGGSGGFGDNLGGAGGAGGVGVGTTTIAGGAGGAGGASNGGAGGSASGPNGGAGGSGGGPAVSGSAGNNFGGGGGGGGDRASGTNTAGGVGASGAVVISYTSTVTLPNAGSDQNACGALFLNGNTPDAGWTGTWSVVFGSATVTNVNDPSSAITGIAPGSCVGLRWTFSSPGCANTTDNVTICVPSVCNDDPCNASPIAVGTSCSYTSYSNVGGTVSTGMIEPACASFSATASEDVWFSAVVPANGVLEIEAVDNPGVAGTFFPGIAIYSGTCTNLMHQGCDQTTSSVTPSHLTYTGTPGETIFIRVWDFSDNTGSFNLCAFTHNNPTGSIVTGNSTITCGNTETFMDPGGTGNYGNEMSGFWTICPDTPGEYVSVDFTSFALQTNFDYLTVMDGGNGSSPIIGNYTGFTNPGVITSSATDGCLSFMFRSDNVGTAAGWTANVTCSSTPGNNTVVCTSTNCPGECGTWICSDGLYPTENQGSSSVEEITYQSGGCWLGSGEISTSWFYFTVLTTGTIEITFDGPNGQDYDFSVYGPSTNGVPPCPSNTGDSPIRCSYSAAANPVGLGNGATDFYEDAGGDGWVAPINGIAGETYVLAFNIFQNGNPQPIIDATFSGTGTLDCTPVFLPITLQSVDGMNQGSKNLITWITNSEHNNNFFTVERSRDVENWTEVGHLPGAGNSQMSLMYSMTDYEFYTPITYYRLKQTDYNGEVSYSEVISVNAQKGDGSLVSGIYPNITNEHFNFKLEGTDVSTPLSVAILDASGKTIKEMEYTHLAKGFEQQVDVSNLAMGVYNVIFTQGAKRVIEKLVVAKN